MIAIQLTFPAKRFHATPWGRQVNEGEVEWPPSPWRLLRALIAVWHHKCPDISEGDMRSLVAALTPAPHFRLPAASQGHTRHYMPAANDERTKVFDTFIAIERSDPLVFVWPDVSLTAEQREILGRLLASLSYFGRAESWVCAELVNGTDGINAAPLESPVALPGTVEQVRVLAAVDEETLANWRATARSAQQERALAQERQKAQAKGKSAESVKLSKKVEAAIDAALPNSVFDALQVDTDQFRSAGWNLPPGSRWVPYARPADAFERKPRPRHVRRREQLPMIARFAVCGKVRPRLTEALWIGERVRHFIMGCSKAVNPDRNAAEVFSGKDREGNPLNGGQRHAHYLCEASRHDGRISHLTVYAPMGLTEEDERALSRFATDPYVRRKFRHSGHELQFVLLGIGRPSDFGGRNEKAGQASILDRSQRWISRTPFVLPRHPKLPRSAERNPAERERLLPEALVQVVRLELERRPQFRDLAADVRIEPQLGRAGGTDLGGHWTTWLKFRRERSRGAGQRAGTLGYGFVLEFPQPVQGPIALGYGCHFGLGQFIPADRED